MKDSSILVLNAGSSSLKASAYRCNGDATPDSPIPPMWTSQVSWDAFASPSQAFQSILDSAETGAIDFVGHRVVHGGAKFQNSVRITPEVTAAIAEAASWAPEHNRLALQGMAAVERALGPNIPQLAVFDTAFHRSIPREAYVYPGPYRWLEQGIRRFGFHGISHKYAALRAARLLGRAPESLNILTCHLGNGCSLAAVRKGTCVDTTMGFTPLEGLMMGTRSGSIDPGIVIHLLQHGNTAEEIEEMLNHQSGLLGISGISSDMRAVVAAAKEGNDRARLALNIYIHRLKFHIGGLIAVLGSVDALVFTGGVGENAAVVRSDACASMNHFGILLDQAKNASQSGDGDVAAEESRVRILVVKSQEEWQIALECRNLLGPGKGR